MQDMTKVRQGICELFKNTGIREITEEQYKKFGFPKFLQFMKFQTYLYQVENFGYLMMLQSKSITGMELLTCSFTPATGIQMPYLLIDCMLMKKKSMVFTEFYDCTEKHSDYPELQRVYKKYESEMDYNEKPAWYVSERTEFSLIKQFPTDEDSAFTNMIYDTVLGYIGEIRNAKVNVNNLAGLRKLRHRMITEGNPATGILKGAFGKEGAVTFYRKCVMPIDTGERDRI